MPLVRSAAPPAPCSTCNRWIDQELWLPHGGLVDKRRVFMPLPHEASCGLPCAAGGITTLHVKKCKTDGKRLAETIHGYEGRWCPRCGYLEQNVVHSRQGSKG